MEVLYTLISVAIVSLLSLLVFVPFLIRKKISKKFLVILLSLSVGTLFGGVFIHFLPEIIEEGYSLMTAVYILLGILVFFVLEKLVHWHHGCGDKEFGHGHGYHLAPINLFGDAVHNFLDGLVIAGAYVVSIPLGVAATISVIFHEIPQELADFGVLLYSGMEKKKALLFNFLVSLMAVVGAIVGLLFFREVNFILPFAVGNFLYIAGSNLMPELHRHCSLKESFLHVFMIIIGISIMFFV